MKTKRNKLLKKVEISITLKDNGSTLEEFSIESNNIRENIYHIKLLKILNINYLQI